jgi:hypothetical protein
LKHNSFLVSDLAADNFRLSFEVKLIDDVGNSGVQFRSKSLSQNRRGLAHFAESAEQNVPVPLSADGSGIGSKPLSGFHEVRGYQADIGPLWWGKLYEENGRALLWDRPGEQHVKRGEWNRYEIEAVGSRVRTWINGQPCVDLNDPAGKRRGVFALQIHAGPPMEVRFRNVQLDVK